ncbi:MAG: hypothetical protein D6743_05715 [Calditrichaeota bacterium]|nr:MAG: hypothetical protein D6743_05715 [Calditrichota bacterium]
MQVITLLTDFGSRDGFVGIMKGVMLGICPRARIVDISHDIAPQDVEAAAFVLKNSFAFFPKGTVHTVVVDPGVGSQRRVLGVAAAGHIFLAPDNGVLKYIFAEQEAESVVEVKNAQYFLPEVSQTFHGRDIFAPVAAHLAKGLALGKLGPEIRDYQRGRLPVLEVDEQGVRGEVVYIDRFGNLISNIPATDLAGLSGPDLRIDVAGRSIRGLSTCYAEAAAGKLLALVGSSGFLEIAVNGGNARQTLRCEVGASVRVRFAKQQTRKN